MTCERFNSFNKNSSIFNLDPYEGIPENFLINIIIFTILFAIFLVLRKKFWNYGRIALHNKPIDLINVAPMRHSTCSSLEDVEILPNDDLLLRKDTVNDKNIFLTSLPLFVGMSDEMLKKRCGQDAVIYCMFQRMLIIVTIVMNILSLTIILPINIHGNLQSNDSAKFITLTIANMNKNSKFLYFHVSIALILMIFVFLISNKFLNYVDADKKEKLRSTLMISNIPMHNCKDISIEKHLQEAYPYVNIVKIQQAYEIGDLFDLYTKKVITEDALAFCHDLLVKENHQLTIMTKVFGRESLLFKCCKGSTVRKIDGITYYQEELNKLNEAFINEKQKALTSRRLPIYFVTLENSQQALLIRKEYKYQNYFCINQLPSYSSKSPSSLSEQIQSNKWNVIFASKPSEILWQYLHKHGWKLWMQIFFMNVLLGFFVIIFSTPAIVIDLWAQINLEKWIYQSKIGSQIKSTFGSKFLVSLVMVLVSSGMHYFVCFVDENSGHWTKTRKHISIMNKLFAVLITTILILPSIGLPSIFFSLNIFQNNTISKLSGQLECIFLPGGGSIFCNYLISAAFIGMGIDLLRIGDLLTLIIKFCSSRSRAEYNTIMQSVLCEFPYGTNYAWTLSLFCIISSYAVIVPLVTPFGLAYLISRHLVDRYNLINVYLPTSINNEVHANATKLMQTCLIFTQVTVTVYVALRQENYDNPIIIFCLLSFFLGILLTVGRNISRGITSMAWHKYQEKRKLNDVERPDIDTADAEDVEQVYLPEQITTNISGSLPQAIDPLISIVSVDDKGAIKSSVDCQNDCALLDLSP